MIRKLGSNILENQEYYSGFVRKYGVSGKIIVFYKS
jgi:hypothetical protein